MLLFLGSGVSYKSGLPGVVELTKQILDGNHNDPLSESDKRPGSLGQAQQLLRLLAELDSHYLSSIAPSKSRGKYIRNGAIYRHSTTYEDLFHLCQQINQSGMGLADDAQTGTLIDVVEQRAGALLDGYTHDARVVHLYHLAHRASRLIEQVLGEQLHAENIEGLDLVLELARSPDIEHLDIVTLNHDTLVEELLAENEISFTDGFGPLDGSVRWYDDGLFDDRSLKVRIIKPHGSVNWYSSSVNGRPQTVIVESGDPITSRTEANEQLRIHSNQPSFLTGGSKILAYNRGIYSEMFYRFHLMLREHRFMIMSGYGWSDTGINFRLTNWLDTYRASSLLLLYKEPEKLSGNSLQLHEYYNGLVNQGQLVPGTDYLSSTTMDDVHRYWHGHDLM